MTRGVNSRPTTQAMPPGVIHGKRQVHAQGIAQDLVENADTLVDEDGPSHRRDEPGNKRHHDDARKQGFAHGHGGPVEQISDG